MSAWLVTNERALEDDPLAIGDGPREDGYLGKRSADWAEARRRGVSLFSWTLFDDGHWVLKGYANRVDGTVLEEFGGDWAGDLSLVFDDEDGSTFKIPPSGGAAVEYDEEIGYSVCVRLMFMVNYGDQFLDLNNYQDRADLVDLVKEHLDADPLSEDDIDKIEVVARTHLRHGDIDTYHPGTWTWEPRHATDVKPIVQQPAGVSCPPTSATTSSAPTGQTTVSSRGIVINRRSTLPG